MQRKYNILPYDVTMQSLTDWAIQVTREREIDLDDYNNQISGNPVIYSVPASSSDIKGTEKVGDISVDASYMYVVVNNSGTLEWRRVAISSF